MGMDIGLNEYTLAIVTLDKNMKNGGGCPIFYANDEKDLQNKAAIIIRGITSNKIAASIFFE